MPTKKPSPTTEPAASPKKPSQGGYGHKSTPGGTTTPQGSGQNQPGQPPK